MNLTLAFYDSCLYEGVHQASVFVTCISLTACSRPGLLTPTQASRPFYWCWLTQVCTSTFLHSPGTEHSSQKSKADMGTGHSCSWLLPWAPESRLPFMRWMRSACFHLKRHRSFPRAGGGRLRLGRDLEHWCAQMAQNPWPSPCLGAEEAGEGSFQRLTGIFQIVNNKTDCKEEAGQPGGKSIFLPGGTAGHPSIYLSSTVYTGIYIWGFGMEECTGKQFWKLLLQFQNLLSFKLTINASKEFPNLFFFKHTQKGLHTSIPYIGRDPSYSLSSLFQPVVTLPSSHAIVIIMIIYKMLSGIQNSTHTWFCCHSFNCHIPWAHGRSKIQTGDFLICSTCF